jgi:Mg-chelatase subunit ChlD
MRPPHFARFACLLAVVLGALALVAPAGSAASRRIAITRVDKQQFPLVQVTLRIPVGAKGAVHGHENGQAIHWQLTKGSVQQAIALSVDTSNSMKGKRITAVRKAAISFVRQQPRRVVLGVYAFSAQAQPAAAFPASHQGAIQTLKQLGPAGPDGTALYASIIQASTGLSHVNAARRALIVVTDGQSYRDHDTLKQAIAAAQHDRVAVYPIAIVTPVLDKPSLRRLASATGGQLNFARKSADLDRLYRTLARKIAATRTYSYLSNAQPYQAIHLVFSMKGHGTAHVTAAPFAPGSKPVPHKDSGLPTLIIAVLMFTGVCLLFGVGIAVTRLIF